MEHGPSDSSAGSGSRALQLGLLRNPQDGSADFGVTLRLSSSYITYSVAMMNRLQGFFNVDEVYIFLVPKLILPKNSCVLEWFHAVGRPAMPLGMTSRGCRVPNAFHGGEVFATHAGAGPVFVSSTSRSASRTSSFCSTATDASSSWCQTQAAAACDSGCT